VVLDLSTLLSWRKPGPITTGFSRCAKAINQHVSKRPPRRMGPGFRQDDTEYAAAAFLIVI
jgi:hypothetical protein